MSKVTTADKLIGVWVKGKGKENKKMWDKVFSIENGAVSFFYSDKPLDAMKARNILQAKTPTEKK